METEETKESSPSVVIQVSPCSQSADTRSIDADAEASNLKFSDLEL